MGPLSSLVSFAWFVPVSCVMVLLNAPIVCPSFLGFEYYFIACVRHNLLLIPAPWLDIWDASSLNLCEQNFHKNSWGGQCRFA